MEEAITDQENPSKEKKVTRRSTAGYWLKWVAVAKDANKKHWSISQDAWNEFLKAAPDTQSSSQLKSPRPDRFPIFWSSIKNLQPAYYSRTPETVARRMFQNKDPIARTACLLLERVSKYNLQTYPIDPAMVHATLEFLITDKATARIYLEEEKAITTIQEPVIVNQQTGEYIGANTGEVLDTTIIQQNPDGSFFTESTEERIVKVCPYVVQVAYNDIIHTPNAQFWEEVKEIGFRVFMSKHEFREEFGEEIYNVVCFGATNSTSENDLDATTNEDKGITKGDDISSGIEVWEIWDKEEKKVRWVSNSYREGILKETEDEYKLTNFFPCAPFIIGTKPPKSLYPTPMFEQVRPMVDQLHRIFTRICKMTTALRRRGIADKAMADVIASINELDDFEVFASSHYQDLVDKQAAGSEPIWYLPLGELSQALGEARELLQAYKELFYEITGVPDVVRGVSDYRETASAQQQKGQFYNVRSSWDQQMIQELARNLIEMQSDLTIARMPDDLFLKVAGAEFLDEEDKQYITQALALLRDNENRSIRIDIETDSLTWMQSQQKQADANLIVQTIMQGLTQVGQIGQTNPLFTKPALEMLLMSLRGVDAGKAYEEGIEQVSISLEQAAAQPEQAPPDYEGMKMQLEQQKMQSNMEIEQQKMQLEINRAQIQQGELNVKNLDQQLKQYIAQSDAQRKDQELVLKSQELQQNGMKLQTDAEIKMQQLQIDASVANSKVDVDNMNTQLEGMNMQLNQQIEQQKMELSRIEHSLTMQEKLMEEKRLARDSEIQIAKTLLEQEKMQMELQKMMLDVSRPAIEAETKKPKKRVHKIVKTLDGFIGQSEDIDD